MRWPCGPLEVERARRREGFTADESDALVEWRTPTALERLTGTPVNCLVLSWAEGSARDGQQRQALASLVDAARRRGLSLVG